MSFSFLYFDRVRLTEAMVIPYHVKVNRMNGSNPESNYKKIPWLSAWIGGEVATPRPAVSEVNRRGGSAPPGSYIMHIRAVLGRGERNLLRMHSYGVHRRDGEHTLFKEGVKIFFRNPSPFNGPQRLRATRYIQGQNPVSSSPRARIFRSFSLRRGRRLCRQSYQRAAQ